MMCVDGFRQTFVSSVSSVIGELITVWCQKVVKVRAQRSEALELDTLALSSGCLFGDVV